MQLKSYTRRVCQGQSSVFGQDVGALMSLGPDVSISLCVATSVYTHVPERQDSCLFGTKMKASQLGRKLESEHFVSLQHGELHMQFSETYRVCGVIYRVRLPHWRLT